MSKVPLCSLRVEGITEIEKEELLTAIRLTGIEVQSSPSRDGGIVEAIFLIGVLAQLTEQSIKAGKAMSKWLEDKKKAGKKITGELKRPDKPPLDLATASYEEIKQWLSRDK